MKSKKSKSLICCLLLCSMLLGLCSCASSSLEDKLNKLSSFMTQKQTWYNYKTLVNESEVKITLRRVEYTKDDNYLDVYFDVQNKTDGEIWVFADHIKVEGLSVGADFSGVIDSEETKEVSLTIHLDTLACGDIHSFKSLILPIEVMETENYETIFSVETEVKLGKTVRIDSVAPMGYEILTEDVAALTLVGVNVVKITHSDGEELEYPGTYVELFLRCKANFPKDYKFTNSREELQAIDVETPYGDEDLDTYVNGVPVECFHYMRVRNHEDYIGRLGLYVDESYDEDDTIMVELPLNVEEGYQLSYPITVMLKLRGDGTVLSCETQRRDNT